MKNKLSVYLASPEKNKTNVSIHVNAEKILFSIGALISAREFCHEIFTYFCFGFFFSRSVRELSLMSLLHEWEVQCMNVTDVRNSKHDRHRCGVQIRQLPA